MLRFVTIAAVSMFAFLTPASGEPRRETGEQDGIKFDYTAELLPNQDVRLRGLYVNTRERFSLTVTGKGWVNGRVGHWPVGFRISQQQRDRLVTSLRPKEVTVAQANTGQ